MNKSRTKSATKPKPAHISLAECERLLVEHLPMMADWGVQVEAIGHGTATLSLPGGRRFLRPGETVSGPVMMGLADVALYAALLGAVSPAPARSVLRPRFSALVGGSLPVRSGFMADLQTNSPPM